MKLLGDGGTPYALSIPGVEKSSIILLNMIPVLLPLTLEPKLQMSQNIHINQGYIKANQLYLFSVHL